ncbi:GlxA family transcriptional regulator [Actinosynnema sp. ALI-1.44]|uniref:GlxA family transcriptional regulator n=1 Tax=Actinosynnema sp. ALI-1.44 TaxID=1933779 RepID=UPI00192D0EC6|nr:helix-turn-helix domain-containing protein [Actinosynnema sp. ALI-1.44]
MTHVVAVLALSEAIGYDLTIPSMVFDAADEDYDVRICGVDDKPVDVYGGYRMVLEHGPEALAEADTVVVPGTRILGPRSDGTLPADVADALALVRPGTRVMSICTGAFVLAAAGLLDGRPATTHWNHTGKFRELYPDVRLDEDVLFVDDGDVLTSAGLAAGIDLCLHVLRNDHGSEVANRAARYCVVPSWRDGGQRQFIERPMPEIGDTSTAPTRAWALGRLSDDLDLDAMAGHANMSVRTFSRRFRAETGMSPGKWLLKERIEHARHLLESTDLAVEKVARESGLGTAASLRQHLRVNVGVSPLTYRKTFRPPS